MNGDWNCDWDRDGRSRNIDYVLYVLYVLPSHTYTYPYLHMLSKNFAEISEKHFARNLVAGC